MKKAVLNVKSVEHRLELRPASNITYIDDSYNSNPVGSKMALDVLKDMPGLRIIMTPGMVELGDKSYELNKKLNQATELTAQSYPKAKSTLDSSINKLKTTKQQYLKLV